MEFDSVIHVYGGDSTYLLFDYRDFSKEGEQKLL